MSSNIRLTRICQQCGQPFEAKTTVTKTCSDACAKRAYKARQKAAKIEQSNHQTREGLVKPIEEIKAKENLNIADASRLLGVSRWTLWRAIGAGNLQVRKLGRRTIIRRTDLDRLLGQPIEAAEHSQPELLTLAECYTLKEVRQKYSISEKALSDLIRRYKISKQYSGIYAYVSKQLIDDLLK